MLRQKLLTNQLNSVMPLHLTGLKNLLRLTVIAGVLQEAHKIVLILGLMIGGFCFMVFHQANRTFGNNIINRSMG